MKSVIKTTVNLKPHTFARLKTFTNRGKMNMSQVIEAGINWVINDADKDRPQRVWKNLKDMKGISISDPELKDKSVDEILYGDDGIWRGSER